MPKSKYGETLEVYSRMLEIGRLRALGKYDEAVNILNSIRQDYQSRYESGINTRAIIEELHAEEAQKKKHRDKCSLLVDKLESETFLDGCSELDKLKYKNNAAVILLKSGEYARCYTMFKEVASRQAELLDPTDKALLSAQSNMAHALGKLERFEESLALYKEVLDKRRNKSGNDDKQTISTQLNIASVLLDSGACQKAYEQFMDIAARSKRILGPEDRLTLAAQNYMAKALDDQSSLTEDFFMFVHLFEVRKENLSPDHPDTLRSQSLMGLALLRQAEYSEAFKMLSEVLAKQRSILGDTHPDTQASLSYIEALETRAGQKKFTKLQFSCEKNDTLTELIDRINSGDVSGVNALLESGIDISRATVVIGNSPLHIAVNKNNIDTIESLLMYAKKHLSSREMHNFNDARTTSAAGNTAMHIAASNGSLEAIRVLLEYGATHNIKNRKGKTPRELAGDPEVMRFLEMVDGRKCSEMDQPNISFKEVTRHIVNYFRHLLLWPRITLWLDYFTQ